MSLEPKLWKSSGDVQASRPSLLRWVGIGLAAGLVAPFLLLLQGGGLPTSWSQAKLIALWGPVFGGCMAYFMHRFRHLERTAGQFWWTILAGALGGGATAGLAYDLDYFSSPWFVLAGFGLGGLVILIAWLVGDRF